MAHRRLSRSRSPRVVHHRWRALAFEPLEHRVLLNVGPVGGGSLGSDDPDAAPLVEVAGDSNRNLAAPAEDSTSLPRFASAEELRQHLIADALERYSGLFGRHGSYYRYDGFLDRGRVFLAEGGGVFAIAESAGYSDTNTQVAGVDEGDLVETDGDYLYVLSGQELVIVDTRATDGLRVASRVQLDGRPVALYLRGDRVTVLSRVEGDVVPSVPWRPVIFFLGDRFGGAGQGVKVTVLDVSDRETPTLVQETELDGALVDSRAIGKHVYLVLSSGFHLPGPERVPSTSGDGTYVYETQEQYLERIEGQVLDLALPNFSSYGADGELANSGLISKATDIYQPLSPEETSLISVVVIDVTGDTPGPVSSTSVPSSYASEVYVSPSSLYVLSPNYGGWSANGGPETSIRKFTFDRSGRHVDLAAVGTVPGRVLNQFSIDEYDGYLRVATTEGWAGLWNGPGSSENNVFVLQQDGETLEVVGGVENLARGETIYSVRFMADRAFVVTYRAVDPLFAIDLSDPTDPQMTGELKIPGFSNYLHTIDGGYLIGIGRDADEQTGLFQDPQVSLFDVENFSNPELLDRFTIDTGRSGGLGIFDDHHVIAYYPEHQVLTVSVPDAGGWQTGSNDLWVFKVDVGTHPGAGARDGEIQFLTRIEHDSAVLRSVRIGDLLYSISLDTVTVHEILNPDSRLDELDLGMDPLDTANAFRVAGVDKPELQVIGPFLVARPPDPEAAPDLSPLTYYVAGGPFGATVTTAPVVARALPETWLYQGEGSPADRSDVLYGPSVAPVDVVFADFSDDFLSWTGSARALPVDAALHDWESETAWPLEIELEPGLSDFLLESEPGESAALLL